MNVYKRPLFKRQGGSIRVPVPTPPVAMRATPRRMPGSNRRGIGQLMADVAGKVNMESAPGNPNRMGQGLGNIMMARQGGAVQKLANGGSLTEQYYEENRPFFEKILGTSQEDRDAAQKRFIFDQIVTGGLDLARGAGGQGNLASQVANVFRGAPGAYSNMQAGFDAADDRVNLAAFQSADARANAEREQELKSAAKLAELQEGYNLDSRLERQRLINESILKGQENAYDVAAADVETQANIAAAALEAQAAVEGRQADIQQYFSSDGTVLSGPFDMSDAAQRADALAFGKTLPALNAALMPAKDVDAFAPPPKAPSATKIEGLIFPDGRRETFDTNTPEGSAAYQEALKTPGVLEIDLKPPTLQPMTDAAARSIFSNNDLLQSVIDDTITPEQLTKLNSAIAQITQVKPRSTGQIRNGVEVIETFGERLSDDWYKAIEGAQARGLAIQTPGLKSADPVAPVPGTVTAEPNLLAQNYDQQRNSGVTSTLSAGDIKTLNLPDVAAETTGLQKTVMNYPIEDLYGTWAALDRTWNTLAPGIFGIFGQEAGEAFAPDQAEANAEQGLEAFHTLMVETMIAARPGRASNQTREVLTKLLPSINAVFSSKGDSIGKYKVLRDDMESDLRNVNGFLDQGLSRAEFQKFDFIRRELGTRLNELNTIITELGGDSTGSGMSYDEIFQVLTNPEVSRTPYQ